MVKIVAKKKKKIEQLLFTFSEKFKLLFNFNVISF